jgi:hypothetical protein
MATINFGCGFILGIVEGLVLLFDNLLGIFAISFKYYQSEMPFAWQQMFLKIRKSLSSFFYKTPKCPFKNSRSILVATKAR